ncbi:MAG: hypothetical protein AB7G44_16115 [Bacteroidia bacterium]
MKYTIRNISHGPHDMDDDVVFFEFEVHFTEPETIQINYFYDFGRLLRTLQTTQPDFYNYYKKTHSGLDKWGPAETQTLEAMGDEAIKQVYQFLEDYLLTCDWIPTLLEREKQFRNLTPDQLQKQQEAAVKVSEKLSALASPEMKRATNRDRLFCEQASRKMRDVALEVYPEIANLEAEELKEFKHLFTREIMSMQERLEKLLSKNKNS